MGNTDEVIWIVQPTGGSQSMNSYSYALNNPLKYTDPTGYRTNAPYINPYSAGSEWSSAHWQQTANYYNSVYGDHTFWGGGANLTRIQNFGGGLGKVQDGLFADVVTNFVPGNLVDNIHPVIRNGQRGVWINFGYMSKTSSSTYNIAKKLYIQDETKGKPNVYATSGTTYNIGLFWFNFEPIYYGFGTLNNFSNYGSPESEIITTFGASSGLYKYAEKFSQKVNPAIMFKYSKWAGYLGPAGDVLSVSGAWHNYKNDPKLEYKLDLFIAVVGFVPGFGDAVSLWYMGMKYLAKSEGFQTAVEDNTILNSPAWRH